MLLREIAVAQAQAGDLNAATRTFRQAQAAIEVYEDPNYRAQLTAEIAKAQTLSGLSKDSKEWARKLSLPTIRARALMVVVEGILARPPPS